MTNWYRRLPIVGRVVMVWPQMGDGVVQIQLDQEVAALGFQLQPLLPKDLAAILQVENPDFLLYGRPDAKVKREIRSWAK